MLTFRELAYQIADQFRVFGRHIGLKDTVIVGGIGELQNHLGMPPPTPSLLDSQSSSVQYNALKTVSDLKREAGKAWD